MLHTFQLWESGSANAPRVTLELGCLLPETPLSQLLSTLQPLGAAPRLFERLELRALPDAADVARCSAQLGQPRDLSLYSRWLEPGGSTLEQTVAALLQQASRLRSLHIRSDFDGDTLGAVPASLASYRGLTSLEPAGQLLADLPAGEYLAGLHNLGLCHNVFRRLPPTISTATALTRLVLSGNSRLSLCKADTAVLLALPRLQQLVIERIADAATVLLDEWQLRLPDLHISRAS